LSVMLRGGKCAMLLVLVLATAVDYSIAKKGRSIQLVSINEGRHASCISLRYTTTAALGQAQQEFDSAPGPGHYSTYCRATT
jgi:hypothetical protein